MFVPLGNANVRRLHFRRFAAFTAIWVLAVVAAFSSGEPGERAPSGSHLRTTSGAAADTIHCPTGDDVFDSNPEIPLTEQRQVKRHVRLTTPVESRDAARRLETNDLFRAFPNQAVAWLVDGGREERLVSYGATLSLPSLFKYHTPSRAPPRI